MAKITCSKCNAEVDEEESFCPNCGNLLVDAEDDEVRYYVEEKKWTFGNTLIALLLTLLIAALGVFLYLNGLKWPYEDATRYYNDEKAAYEQQVAEYKEIPAQIASANDVLDAKIDQLRAVLNSGEEPLDPRIATASNEIIQKAMELRIEVPVIEASPAPAPDKDSIFHAKEIRETGRMIDQMRFGLYQQYGNLAVPDYAPVIDTIDRAKAQLQASIEQKKQSENVSPQLKELLDNYRNYMNEYIEFMSTYDRSDTEQIRHAGEMQTTFVTYLKQLRAIDVTKLPEDDANYYNAVTQNIGSRLSANGLTEPDFVS